MIDAITPLLKSGLINEDIGKELTEAFESQLTEAREQVRAELREEFATRYEHDRNVMVEALDKMVTEGLTAELQDFQAERRALHEDRVNAKKKLNETASKFNSFLITKLSEEIRELRTDRSIQKENQQKLEQFVVHALAREIKEFSQDKQAIVEAKVKLVAEGRQKLSILKDKFVSESAARLNQIVTRQLKGELSQLKEDIVQASENLHGRKIFEAFAAEFSATFLNEKAETRKLVQQLKQKEIQLAEAKAKIGQATRLIESKEREVRIIKESNLRQKTMEELLSPLNEEKSQVMRSLLESVQTTKLKATFDKYLPAVLNTGNGKAKTALSESKQSGLKEVTGDKSAIEVPDTEERDNVIDIKRLAGL